MGDECEQWFVTIFLFVLSDHFGAYYFLANSTGVGTGTNLREDPITTGRPFRPLDGD